MERHRQTFGHLRRQQYEALRRVNISSLKPDVVKHRGKHSWVRNGLNHVEIYVRTVSKFIVVQDAIGLERNPRQEMYAGLKVRLPLESVARTPPLVTRAVLPRTPQIQVLSLICATPANR